MPVAKTVSMAVPWCPSMGTFLRYGTVPSMTKLHFLGMQLTPMTN